MNNSDNDLQKAIDDIARGTDAQQGPTTVDEVLQGGNDFPPAPAPVIPDSPSMAQDVPVTQGPADVTSQYMDNNMGQETNAPEQTSAMAPEEPKGEDLGNMDVSSVKDKAIDELKPIIGTVDLAPILAKIDLSPETKFRIYRDIIETTRDKTVLGYAYATAKDITSDESRAEALLYLVEMAEKLG